MESIFNSSSHSTDVISEIEELVCESGQQLPGREEVKRVILLPVAHAGTAPSTAGS